MYSGIKKKKKGFKQTKNNIDWSEYANTLGNNHYLIPPPKIRKWLLP